MTAASGTKARTKGKKATQKPLSVTASRQAFNALASNLAPLVKKGQVEDLINRNVEVIPTGMLGLDIATGIGGFPVGRIIELYGMESCGKSTVLYHLITEAQKLGYLPIMIETEGSIDTRYLRRIGVDLERLMVVSPDNQEAAIDFIEQAASMAHDMDQRALIMLDSVAALAPEVMMESSAEQKFRATAANVWSQQMPKIMTLLRRTQSTLVLVNQMREPMDMYRPPSTPGGKAIKFAASMRVMMRRKIEKNTDADSQSGHLGQTINFIIEKNKLASPGRKGLAFLPPGHRVDLIEDVANRGIERGLIQKNVKFEDGVLVKKNTYFTIDPDEDMVKAINKDIKRAETKGAVLPGTKAGPYLQTDEPISVRYDRALVEMLEMAPNLVQALREKILDTLRIEAEMVFDDPFEAALAEAIREFDDGAEDGLVTEDLTHAIAKNVAEEEDAEDAAAKAASGRGSDDDDLAEFENN